MLNIDPADLAIKPLAIAETLSSQCYTDVDFFEFERCQIFHRSWQVVARLSQLEKPGDYVTANVAGEPVVVVRDRDGTLRAMSSVCPHRGGPIVEGAGNQKVPFFQCRYHAWTFNFDGSVRSTPQLQLTPEERPGLCLPQIRVETWRSLVFVNLDPDAAPLAPLMRGIDTVLPVDPLAELKFQFQETFEIKCNWKVFQYNSHECYHCNTIHPDTVCKILHPNSLETLATDSTWLYTRYEAKETASDARVGDVQSFTATGNDTSKADAGFFALHMFPNTMITYTPPGYAMLVRMVPQAPDRTLLIREHYFHDSDAAKIESVRSFRESVIGEDIEICEAVQRNLSSKLFTRGRFVPKREWQSYWFETRVREALAGGVPGEHHDGATSSDL